MIRIGITIRVIAVAFLLRGVLTAYFGPGLPTYITFYPAVTVVALAGGLSLGLVATAMSVREGYK